MSLRIALVSSQFHPTIGGAESQLLQLARLWCLSGHRVEVITQRIPEQPRHESFAETEDRLTIHRVVKPIEAGPIYGVSFIWGIYRGLRKLGPLDVVLAGLGPWEAIATGLFRRLRKVPTLARIANTGPFGDIAQLNSADGSIVLRWLYRQNTGFLTPSDEGDAELNDIGIDPGRIRRFRNGVDLERFRPDGCGDHAERSRTVAFIGRMVEQKDPRTLLAAWNLRIQRPSRLLMVGDGPLVQNLQRQTTSPIVAWKGKVQEIEEIHKEAGIFVLPSRSEGTSNALLEAMASGMAVIASDIPGNRTLVDHEKTGLLVPVGDPVSLARAMDRLMADPELAGRLGREARAWVEANHSAREAADHYLQYFQQLSGKSE